MKYFKIFPLGIMLLSVYSYGADPIYGSDTTNETSKAIAAISACYNSSTPSPCLGNLSDKEKAHYENAYSVFYKGLNYISEGNGPHLAREAQQGKKLWESALQHDCKARGLEDDDGSPAYSDNVSNCLAIQYARRVDFYNGFTINSDHAAIDKVLKKYKQNPASQ